MANLKEYLKGFYESNPNFHIWELSHEMDFASLPIAESDDAEEFGADADEEVDFENCEILDIDLDTNTITIVAGGDWQMPTAFSVTLKDDCRFHYNDDASSEGYRDGLTNERVKELLGIVEN